MTTTTDVVDRIAMGLGGGLMLLGIVVMGLINDLAGAPHVPVEEEGAIVATPVVSPDLRAYLIALGLLVWFVYGVYKLTSAPPTAEIDSPAAPADD
ncbi:hypothetical protein CHINAEXTREME_13210 [Halobiforma lacisalsi AJ5]|uniref:Uncharacterized protein n=2 Tax=Natronobacterium lacisalsi AJ5 TaxID=358396 RepID=A0A1P8LSA2_NATLA|nr:hypothetical protein [Halobiforma lacisalsi]APW98678.1 hypothetical protein CHINAEXTREME_13210 [Halobiforma lacisalsi AJ5]